MAQVWWITKLDFHCEIQAQEEKTPPAQGKKATAVVFNQFDQFLW